jgi:hypothetical protein
VLKNPRIIFKRSAGFKGHILSSTRISSLANVIYSVLHKILIKKWHGWIWVIVYLGQFCFWSLILLCVTFFFLLIILNVNLSNSFLRILNFVTKSIHRVCSYFFSFSFLCWNKTLKYFKKPPWKIYNGIDVRAVLISHICIICRPKSRVYMYVYVYFKTLNFFPEVGCHRCDKCPLRIRSQPFLITSLRNRRCDRLLLRVIATICETILNSGLHSWFCGKRTKQRRLWLHISQSPINRNVYRVLFRERHCFHF